MAPILTNVSGPKHRAKVLLWTRNSKMARNAHAYVRGSTVKFYECLEASDGKLPALVITYLTLALCLFPEDDYEEVATKVTGSLDRWNCWNASWSVPSASAITQARKRLGRTLFPEIFERTCGPVAGSAGVTAGVTALGTARGSFRSKTMAT